ncbi:Predicted O-linked N-acetylglucosamine transferase, SPINDLY family [Rhodoferax sp. OV413]|uniref:tetratricopeptide repeat protein n=1 Tax=Rhodoferax sp. OV413 TaxID=1855285 RepID=UPI00088D08FE|nr:tetratricopeptide repeat protein [Rhodoferax sp. OV413]SDO95240.1 Predicted O-linked N-acetylglucosamine transferase, SPINDLY family [Rhodoferax sp. OV413]
MNSWLKKLFSAGSSPVPAAPLPAPAVAPPETSADQRRRGNRFLDQGNLAAALACYRQAAALDPHSADAHTSLGYALQQSGDLVAAQASLAQALQLQPENFDAAYLSGQVCASLEQPEQAIRHWEAALALQPTFEPLYAELCQALSKTGAWDKAVSTLAGGMQRFPNNAVFHFLRGNLHTQAQEWTEAAVQYAAALRLNPQLIEAHGNLAAVFQAQHNWQQAWEQYEHALRLNPRDAAHLTGRATVLLQLGQHAQALRSCQEALAIAPNSVDAHRILGYIHLQTENYSLAAQHSRKALELAPRNADALNNLGNALASQGELHDAANALRAAVAIDATSAVFHSNLGGILLLQGKLEDAIHHLRHATTDPKSPPSSLHSAYSNLLFALNYHPDLGAEEIFESYRAYERSVGAPLKPTWAAHSNVRRTDRRLKVGYVSPDFKNHAASFFLEPLLSQHNRQVVELYAYAELAKEDAVTQRYKQYVDHWVPTQGMSDAALAERIRADGIDILVDAAGHTVGNRLAVFARKPAPVSVSWMGYGYTTGLQAVDYYLTDATSAPAGSEPLFSEAPWRLPGCYVAYRASAAMGEVNALPALERGYITLGTLTRAIRINHRTIRVWTQILQRLPTARLVIDSRSFEDPKMQEETLATFTAQGIAAERLQIGFHSPPWDVLRGIDIGLDCFPHNSGTTLFETLYMGLPYVTLEGRPSVGRMGSAILHGLGHSEWIAQTEVDYVEKVVALASDLPALAQLRATLRQQMQTSVLMDEPGFARAVESAYADMFAHWAAQPA